VVIEKNIPTGEENMENEVAGISTLAHINAEEGFIGGVKIGLF
jgi:hypothetical protein